MNVDKQINTLSNEIKELYGEEYSKQFSYAINDIKEKTDIKTTHIIIDLIDLSINDDYKQHQINALQKENKQIKQEVKELKDTVIEFKNELYKKDNQISKLEKNMDILMKKNYNLILWQAYKNLEYYIIQNTTHYDDIQMESINTNINDFINNPENKKYYDLINNLCSKFKINSYINSLGKLNKRRINVAHPNPIEMDELQNACNEMKNEYNGIEELYNNYQEVYDYFN